MPSPANQSNKKIDRLYISWKIVIRFALDFIFKDAILYLKKWKLKGFSQESIYFKVQFCFVLFFTNYNFSNSFQCFQIPVYFSGKKD